MCFAYFLPEHLLRASLMKLLWLKSKISPANCERREAGSGDRHAQPFI